MLLCGMSVGCTGGSTGKGGGSANDTGVEGGGAGGSVTTDSGTELAPPPQFAVDCPEGPFPTTYQGDYPTRWLPLNHPIEGGEGDVLIDTDLLAYPSEWGSAAFGVWLNRTDPHGYLDSLESSFAGHFRMVLTPHDEAGQYGEPLVCDLEYHNLEDFYVEMATHPDATGDRQLHFVLEGGALFDESADVCFCNPVLNDMGAEGDADYIRMGEWDSGRSWAMSQEEGIVYSLHPGPERRVPYVYDAGGGLEEEPGLPYETEIRVYIYGELVHTVRGRIPAEEVWTVGVADLGRLEFEPAPADTFVPHTGPQWCY